MTDPIGDALNNNSPLWDEVEIRAEWPELPPGYLANAQSLENLDNLMDLGQQIGPTGYKVEHSLIDGLPDSVTMTTGNDGFGSALAELVGRPANWADQWNFRATIKGAGTGSSVSIGPATGTTFNDYQLVAVVSNTTGDVTDANADPYNRFAWTTLAQVTDGTVRLTLFGRRYYTGAPNLSVTFTGGSTAYSWISMSAWASTAAYGTWVDVKPGVPVTLAESVTGTAHTIPAQTLPGRGWMLGFWGITAASGPMTPTGGDTEIEEQVGGTYTLMLSRSAMQPSPTKRTMTANTTGSTGVVAAIGIPLYFADRLDMRAPAYFSPFRTDSPLYGFDRDIAPVTVRPQIVTPANGVQAQTIFTGQMSDIAVRGSSQTADMTAVSKTRVLMDRARVPPQVFGRREGLTVDWFANWLMANGGQTVAPGPSTKTRLWVPFYGSVRPYSRSIADWTDVSEWKVTGQQDRHIYPQDLVGPYVSAMDGAWTDTRVYETSVDFDRFPHTYKAEIPGIDIPEYNDFISQKNSEGQFGVWLRCDPFKTATLPTVLGGDSSRNYLFQFQFSAQTAQSGGTNAGGATFTLDPTTGTGGARPKVAMGTQLGYQTVNLTGLTFPSDGQWHFFGAAWDFANARMKVRFDNTLWTLTTDFASVAGASFMHKLFSTEEACYLFGGYVYKQLRSHLPIADFQVETGPGMYADNWSRHYPKKTPAAIYRRTGQWMEALTETNPLSGWSTLLELGKDTVSMVRCNEEDKVEFLPPSYFGETEQAEVQTVEDTEVNTSELEVVVDPSNSRNVITITYPETAVFPRAASILDLPTALEIPPGISEYTLALDLPAVELHGGNNPWTGSFFDIVPLTSTQITNNTPPAGSPFMTVNSKSDGSGTVPGASAVTGRLIGQPDAQSVIIRLRNNSPSTYYLANQGSDVPFLRLLGYGVVENASYATTRDEYSVRVRNERTLTHDSKWVTRREEARLLGASIANVVSMPRAQVRINVMGDPRRRPGQLVEIVDSENTQARGTWRILAVQHSGNGPQFTQTLTLIRVGEFMIWDGTPSWNVGLWAE